MLELTGRLTVKVDGSAVFVGERFPMLIASSDARTIGGMVLEGASRIERYLVGIGQLDAYLVRREALLSKRGSGSA